MAEGCTSHSSQRQALSTSTRMSDDTSSQLLLAKWSAFLKAFLGALLWIPLGNFAILEEARVAIAFHLHEFSSDLLQSAKLSLKVDAVIVASFHLLSQVTVQLIVLSCCLTSSLSCSGFLLSGKAKLCLRIGQNVLIVLDLCLQSSLSLHSVFLHIGNVLHKCIPVVLDASLNQEETLLQLVAFRPSECALGGSLGFWRWCSTICIIARVHWYLCSWHWWVVELCLIDDGTLLNMCIQLHKLHGILHGLNTLEQVSKCVLNQLVGCG